jgi:hypothetical protein
MNNTMDNITRAMCDGNQVTVITQAGDRVRGWVKSIENQSFNFVITLEKHEGKFMVSMYSSFIKSVEIHD